MSQSLFIVINRYMHSLRSALGKETQQEEASMSRKMPSKLTNKSKNGSIWAIDPEDEQTNLQDQGQQKENNKIRSYIQIALNSAYKNEPNFTEMCFFEVVQEIQSKNPKSTELQCLLLVEQKIRDIHKTAEKQLQEFLSAFNESLIKRIKKLKKKDKKNELEQFDKIVKNNFKKKGTVEYIDEDGVQRKNRLEVKEEQLARRPVGSKDLTKNQGSSRKNGSGSSSDGKLGQLLSSKKLAQDKKEVNAPSNGAHQQSISFTAIVSQSMTVRQRNSKQVPKAKKPKQQVQNKKGKEQNEKDEEDEAFMFYRPKATKKK